MNYPLDNPAENGRFTTIESVPKFNVLEWLWQRPAKVGFYGDGVGLVIVGNSSNEIARVLRKHGQDKQILALDSSGFALITALTSGLLNQDVIRGAIEHLAKSQEIYLPLSLYRWVYPTGTGSSISQNIVILSDDFSPLQGMGGVKATLSQFEQQSEQSLPVRPRINLQAYVKSRIDFLGLVIGQMMIFLLPLLLFGWRVALIGLSGLFLTGIFNCVYWNKKSLPGLIISFVFGLFIGVVLLLVFGNQLPVNISGNIQKLVVLFIAAAESIWIWIIFHGKKAEV